MTIDKWEQMQGYAGQTAEMLAFSVECNIIKENSKKYKMEACYEQ